MATRQDASLGLSAEVESAARALVQIIARDMSPGEHNVTGRHLPSQEAGGSSPSQAAGRPSNSLASSVPTDRVTQAMRRQFPAIFTSQGHGVQQRGKKRFAPLPKLTVTHAKRTELQIYVLAEPAPSNTAKYTPKESEELVLAQAGLGKRLVVFKDDAKHDEIFEQLEEEFPKLKDLKRRWMFYKATGGSGRRKLSMIVTDAEGYSMRLLKCASSNGRNVIYLVPLQESLSIDPLPYDAPEFAKMPQASCVLCDMKMPLQMLALHAEQCSKSELEVLEIEECEVTDGKESFGTCPICQAQILTDLLPVHASLCLDSSPSPSRRGAVAGPSGSSNRDEFASTSTEMDVTGPSSSFSMSSPPAKGSAEWMEILNPRSAALLYCRNVLREHDQAKALRFLLDVRDSPEEQERSILGFYKASHVNWAAPLKCILQGDAAVGDGVNRHFFNLTMEKLRSGFSLNFGMSDVTILFEGEDDHLVPCCSQTLLDSDLFLVAGRIIGHSFLHGGPLLAGISPAIVHVLVGGDMETAEVHLNDCPDLDQRQTIHLLDGNDCLSEEQRDQVNSLAASWDLPWFSEHHRQWLFNRMLQYAVLDRTKSQVKQLRRGLKESQMWPLMTARRDVTALLFPRANEVEYGPEDILRHIIWPEEDSDDESVSPAATARGIAFLEEYIKKATTEQLQRLMAFWTGWAAPSQNLEVKMCKGRFFKASTCSRILMLPSDVLTMEDFASTMEACVRTTNSGFGLV